ncbi:hypothetical protein ACFL10_01570 [Patescibacteria group bacterium]
MPIILGLAASYVEPIIRSFRAAVNDQKTLLAKSVADSMFEIALWDSRGSGTGETTHNAGYPAPLEVDYGFGTAQITWSVIGSPEVDAEHLINGEYTVPSPGSGNAGGDYCSTAEPVVDLVGLENKLIVELDITDQPIDNPLDWPCHWNKLREGESTIIPLYVEDSSGVRNPVDIGLDSFELRIRPACNPTLNTDDYNNQICADNERYIVLGDDTNPNNLDDALVLWTIVANENDENGRQLILQPYKEGLMINRNSYITPFFLNNYLGVGSPFSLTEGSWVLDQDSGSTTLNNYLGILHAPYLQLLVIHTLKDVNNSTIPYIEYQFKAPIDLATDEPISSTAKVVRVDVMIDGGYSETLERSISLPKPISGFVIQQ